MKFFNAFASKFKRYWKEGMTMNLALAAVGVYTGKQAYLQFIAMVPVVFFVTTVYFAALEPLIAAHDLLRRQTPAHEDNQ